MELSRPWLHVMRTPVAERYCNLSTQYPWLWFGHVCFFKHKHVYDHDHVLICLCGSGTVVVMTMGPMGVEIGDSFDQPEFDSV